MDFECNLSLPLYVFKNNLSKTRKKLVTCNVTKKTPYFFFSQCTCITF
jgi:hypothetical protein